MTPDATAAPAEETADQMPAWVPRAIVLFFTGVVALWVLRELFEDLSGFLITILISFFFSFALEPAVNWLERRGFRRGIGTLIMFVIAASVIGGFGFVVGSVLAEQTTNFVDDAPELIDDLENWLQDNIDESIELNRVRDQFLDDDGLGERLTSYADNAVGFGATVVGGQVEGEQGDGEELEDHADGPRLRRTICARLKPQRQRRVLGIWDLAIQKTGGYILSRTVLATISSIATWIAFMIIGVPFPLALAIWVGVLSQFVPVVGVYIAGALPVVLTLLESPTKALWALIFMTAYQQVENYVLAPRIDSRTLKIHPAVAFGSVLAGASVLGPVGALLALPAAATAQGIISATGERYAIEEGSLAEVGRRHDNGTSVVAATMPVHPLPEGDEAIEIDTDTETDSDPD